MSTFPIRGIILIGGGVLLAISFFIGQMAGAGESRMIFLLLGAAAGAGVLILLGNRYWLLIPFAMVSGLPAVPLGGRAIELGELVIAVCFVYYLIRVAMKVEKINLFHPISMVILATGVWIVIIYFQNPVGLAIFGSESIGFRDYQRIFIGFCAFFILANQNIGETEAKWLILIAVFGSVIGMFYSIYAHYFGGPSASMFQAEMDGEGEYSWHQSLSAPARAVVFWMFARYKSSEIFSPTSFGKMALLLAMIALASQSGKRAVFATVLLTPLIASLIRKEWKYAVIYCVLGGLGLSFLVAGHGSLFELPFRVQRSLANLPGNWDPAVKGLTEDGADSFRTGMRELAWKKIEENPVFGKGIGISMDELVGFSADNYQENQQVILAMGSAWHNTWLGLWADFGLPAIILHALLLVFTFVTLYKIFKNSQVQSYASTYGLMILYGVFFATLRSYTSGSSNIAYYLFWEVGLAVALATSLAKRNKQEAAALSATVPLLSPAFAKLPTQKQMLSNRSL